MAPYSSTAHAHKLGRTRDWVELYDDSGLEERQATVVTAQRGPLVGKRIVRDREECERLDHSDTLPFLA